MTFEQIKEKLKSKTVGIAGAGGLGSNCAVALARVGIGKLIIGDFDVVIENNLNRQYFFYHQIGQKKVRALADNIKLINPQTDVKIYETLLTAANIPDIFKECDLIVEAFDLAIMKQMIIEVVLSEMPDKWIVSGLGMAGWGNSNSIRVREIDKLIICGDEVSETTSDLPPIAPRVAIVANMQANEVLRILLGN